MLSRADQRPRAGPNRVAEGGQEGEQQGRIVGFGVRAEGGDDPAGQAVRRRRAERQARLAGILPLRRKRKMRSNPGSGATFCACCAYCALAQAAHVGIVVGEELANLLLGPAGCLGDLPRLPALGVELGDVGG